MGKLIDAEKLNDRIVKEECRRREPAWYDGLDTCRKIIEDLPVVDAVPVTWLKAHSRKYYEDWGEEPVMVENVLEMWQKEQEAR